MTIQINYIIHGNIIEKGTISSCLVQEPINLNKIKELFPFEGIFHFRIKRKINSSFSSSSSYNNNNNINNFSGLEYVWYDLKNENELIEINESIIEVQALVIELSSNQNEEQQQGEDYEVSEYEIIKDIDETLNEIGFNIQSRPQRNTIITDDGNNNYEDEGEDGQPSLAATALNIAQGLQNISLSSVTKNAANLWSTVKSTATQFGMQLSTPIDNLNKVHVHFTTAYDDSIQRHVIVLQELWYALFPGCPFERESPKWREAGWQKPDPTIDIKNTGMLALRCMRYLGQTYPEETQRMVITQRENIKSHYPFAVVGINLTLLLVDLLGIKEKRYTLPEFSNSGYYDMFEDRRAFYELFSLSFLYMDHIWVERKSIRADFGKLINEIKSILTDVMNMKPQSIQEFRQLSSQRGFVVV